MEQVLLTGANGFLGRAVLRRLLREPVRVRACVRTTAEEAPLRATLSEEGLPTDPTKLEIRALELTQRFAVPGLVAGCDSVIHAAGKVLVDRQGPSALYRDQVETAAYVLEAALKQGVSKLVLVTPALSLGAAEKPTAVDASVEWTLHSLPSPYIQASRLRLLEGLRVGSRGLKLVMACPTFCVGPEADAGLAGSLRALLLKPPPLPLVGGLNVVAVQDAAEGVLRCWRMGSPGTTYLLGGHDQSFEQLSRTLRGMRAEQVGRQRRQVWAEQAAFRPWAQLGTRGLQTLASWREQLPLGEVPPSAPWIWLGRWWWYASGPAERALASPVMPLEQTLRGWLGAEDGA